MTDLRDVLDSAAPLAPTPTPDVVSGDLRRGRQALLRRRVVQSSAGLLLTGAAVATGFAVLPQLGPEPVGTRVVTPAAPAAPAAPDAPNPGVDLVPYDGPLHGAAFRPAEIPSGWTVSGDDYFLLLTPPGLATSGHDFVGKILVSIDKGIPNEPLSKDAEIAVGDRSGYAIRAHASALQVWVPRTDGTALRTQAPPTTGWDEATLGRFLGGVTVLAGAKGTSG
jgi:hypothetical protein